MRATGREAYAATQAGDRVDSTSQQSAAVAGGRRLRFNPLQPDVLANPYPSYARMRAEAPVLFDRRFGWLIFRYDDVAAALKDPRLSARRPAPGDPIPRT